MKPLLIISQNPEMIFLCVWPTAFFHLANDVPCPKLLLNFSCIVENAPLALKRIFISAVLEWSIYKCQLVPADWLNWLLNFFFFFFKFIYFFLFWVFVSVQGLSPVAATGSTLHHGVRASHHRGLSYCRAQAPDAQAQQLWPTGLVAPRHVGSSQTRARTHVPCIGRQILNHCATREARLLNFLTFLMIAFSTCPIN